ncbi:uncharacterized protein LOC116156423 [Camelus dromedarius]|uniref:uncharacterized protein LOC116156423 n=1 Tax=Camelus dromedarius TaxID=9838 RepID=UPI003119DE02
MAAGNIFRHAQRSLPRVKQIPLRFKSETTRFLLLYFVRKEGEAVSTGVIGKSILSHGLLDPIEPWRLGSEILPKADGVPRFGSINPRGSELKNILCITHPIMSPVLLHLSTRLAETTTTTKIVHNLCSDVGSSS